MAWGRLIQQIVSSPFDSDALHKHISLLEQASSLGSTPLFFAVLADDSRILEFLLRSGANVNATNLYGESALHWAAQHADAKKIRLLLEAGARRDVIDCDFQSAYDWAASEDHSAEILSLLTVPEPTSKSILKTIFQSQRSPL